MGAEAGFGISATFFLHSSTHVTFSCCPWCGASASGLLRRDEAEDGEPPHGARREDAAVGRAHVRERAHEQRCTRGLAAEHVDEAMDWRDGTTNRGIIGGTIVGATATAGLPGFVTTVAPLGAGYVGNRAVSYMSDNPTHQAAGELTGFVGGAAGAGFLFGGPSGAGVGATGAGLGYAGYSLGSIGVSAFKGSMAVGPVEYLKIFASTYGDYWWW